MLSLRLKAIASFLEETDRIVDIGCDHAYLSIYLCQNSICQSVMASDVNPNALSNAIQNIKNAKLEKRIPTVLSDGLEKINQNLIDTIIISGMGTSTILHILKKMEQEKIKKVILQSNNDLYELRKEMKKLGFYLENEKVIYDKNHYYIVGKYTKTFRKYKKRELYYGIYHSENKKYYFYLKEKLNTIYQKIPKNYWKEKLILLYKKHLLKKYL